MDKAGEREFMDRQTGELLYQSDIVKLQWATRKRNPFGVRRCTVSVDALNVLAKADLSPLDLRVMLYLCSTVEGGNRVSVNQSVIARELGDHQPNVSVSLRRLVERRMIHKTETVDGRYATYRISARLLWRGFDNAEHDAALRSDPEILRVKGRKPRKRAAKAEPTKLEAALPRIAAAARTPIHLTTAAQLAPPMEAPHYERDDYSQA